MDSVNQKLYRARVHFDELTREITAYYKTKPGTMIEVEDGDPNYRKFEFREKMPVPARFGLICGDCLQCMRSCLDYLIWELVLAEGNKPTVLSMFPIEMTLQKYKDAVTKRHRLDGMAESAIAIIDSLQPYHLQDPKESPLSILDELTNINKHRRVLLTSLAAADSAPPLHFPQMYGVVRTFTDSGQVLSETPVWSFLTIQDSAAKDMEITVCLDSLARFIGDKMLPLFNQFFE